MNSIDQAWEKLKAAIPENKRQAFLEYCNACIEQKESGVFREEEVAYKICGCTFMKELTDIPELEAVIDHACDMEIPRESKVGAGVSSLNDDWDEKAADAYKQKQWGELMILIDNAKNN